MKMMPYLRPTMPAWCPKHFPLLLLTLIVINFHAPAQQHTDSLEKKLATAQTLKQKARLNYKLMKAYANTNVPKALKTGKAAYRHAQKLTDKKFITKLQIELGEMMARMGEQEGALDSMLIQGRDKARALGMDTSRALANAGIAYALAFTNRIDSALPEINRAITIYDSIGVKAKLAHVIGNKATLYSIKSDFKNGIETAMQAIKIAREIQDSALIGALYKDIAVMYDEWGNTENAMEYFREAEPYLLAGGNRVKLANLYNSYGVILKKQGKIDSAITYLKKSIDVADKLGYSRTQSMPVLSMAELYEQEGQYEQSLEYTSRALKLLHESKYYLGYAYAYLNFGKVYMHQKKYSTALANFRQSLKFAGKAGVRTVQMESHKGKADALDALGAPAKALKSFRRYASLKDSLFNAKKAKQIENLQARYKNRQKDQQIKLQAAKLEKNNAEIARQEAQARMLYALLGAVFITIVVFAIGYYEKRKATIKIARQRDEIKNKNKILQHQNEEIRTQAENLELANNKITEQKNKLEYTNKQISDSIRYASRIQRAMLPSPQMLRPEFPGHFIFWKPRDVVSGDFYWARKIRGNTLIAVADCTGHGVPGAFVSMLGMAFLNEIVRQGHIQRPGDVLNALRDEIKRSLKQGNAPQDINDGMDISFLAIEPSTNSLQFAGAHNPLLHIRRKNGSDPELTEYKADRMPVSAYIKERPFKNREVILQPGDRLYMFSDGFADQFGGEKGKKFYKRKLKNLLMSIQHLDMPEQKTRIQSTFADWISDKYNQVDDVLLMGLEYNPER